MVVGIMVLAPISWIVVLPPTMKIGWVKEYGKPKVRELTMSRSGKARIAKSRVPFQKSCASRVLEVVRPSAELVGVPYLTKYTVCPATLT